ncbi:hypothetical protein BB558_001605 [Smittium angustum]|uniref:Carbonic anhydrase n=1 Tax=Smittium angustum TaxID=133377 RepID=A0A2U1JAZ0_SMIAN|nr:hypothetical protein BB558_001605 [Smittium angustum]
MNSRAFSTLQRSSITKLIFQAKPIRIHRGYTASLLNNIRKQQFPPNIKYVHNSPKPVPALSLPEQILKYNKEWAKNKTKADSSYFENMTAVQTPEILWIGCSDSRVCSDVLTGSNFGRVFTLRNVGNSLSTTDTNSLAVIQFAVETLKIKHIVIVGHTFCGAMEAAFKYNSLNGPISDWIKPIADLYNKNKPTIDALPTHKQQNQALSELNVKRNVDIINSLDIIKKTKKSGKELNIHGWIYDIENGSLQDLKVS